MKIERLEQYQEEQRQEALGLALRVFMAFEAPDYNDEGFANFSEFVANREKTDPLAMYGAYQDGKLVGMGATRNGGRHICLLFVDKAYHGQGIGRRLVETMKRKCPDPMITVNSSPYAVEIYKKMGFVPTDIELTHDGIRYTPMQCERQHHLGTVSIAQRQKLLCMGRRFK